VAWACCPYGKQAKRGGLRLLQPDGTSSLSYSALYKAAQLPPSFFATFTSAKARRARTGKMSAPAGCCLSNYTNVSQARSLFIPGAHSGGCAAFQDLFVSLLENQGGHAQRVMLSPTKSDDQFFLVKNWRFIGSGSSGDLDYPYVNYPSKIDSVEVKNRLSAGHYGWIGTPEVVEEDGIIGQGNKNPFSDFNRHYIVKIGDVYYDPSYGKKYSSVKQWEDDMEKGSIAGFYRETSFKTVNGETSIRWIIRKNTSATEIKEE